jgi:hypothetical protein
MTLDSKWVTRLKITVEKLKHTPEAPEWLQWALKDALDVAEDLAPRQKPAPTPQNFIYPH